MSWRDLLASGKKETVAIIDIGSSSVSAAVVVASKNKDRSVSTSIAYHTETATKIEGEFDYKRFIREISSALKQVTARLAHSRLTPTRYVCYLSSPFLISQTKIINYQSETPVVFTEKVLHGIARKEAEAFVKRHTREPENNSAPSGFSLLENKIMSVKLNGYDTAEPVGQTANQATLSQYLSGGSTALLQRIRRIIEGECHCRNIEFHSYAFSLFSTMRDYLGQKNSFLAIDVSGELTDVFVVVDGILMENISYPLGQNALIRDIAISQGTFVAEATSQLSLYIGKKLNDAAARRTEAALGRAREKWLGGLRDVLTAVLDNSILPKHIILTGDTPYNSIFIKWLNESDIHRFTLAGDNFQTEYLDHRIFASLHGSPATIKNSYLLFETLFLQKLLASAGARA